MSLYKKGLSGSLVCKNLYDLLTPIPVQKLKILASTKIQHQKTHFTILNETTLKRYCLLNAPGLLCASEIDFRTQALCIWEFREG